MRNFAKINFDFFLNVKEDERKHSVMMGISQFRLPGAGIGMLALFHEKIVLGKFQLDRTGHDRLLKRKSVCLTPVMHGPIFNDI